MPILRPKISGLLFCDSLKISIQCSTLEELKQEPLPKKTVKSTVDMSIRLKRVEEHNLKKRFVKNASGFEVLI